MSLLKIHFQQARFLKSAGRLSQCPNDVRCEVAFIGRSNAGKSSALNVLTRQKNLARVSKTPGRTQLINYFYVNEQLCLVDLPGYGYAKVPQSLKIQWRKNISEYLEKRSSLVGLILLMDIRHPLTEHDLQLLEFTRHYQIPLHILLTKSDKLSQSQAQKTLKTTRESLAGEQHVTLQLFSAPKRKGLAELEAKITDWVQNCA